ncbi:MAG: PQQ-binding-like beta-propeller repeat protein [bacterium]|nr:PQQ-binding-like beta-propeller repeat protein [bacterium]MDE0352910.1 PQQ-binding-like beta-propeller repeat protein [bacterium]
MTRRRGGGLRTASALLALCLIAVACSGGGSDDETGAGAARTPGTGTPLLDIGSDTTWRDLVEAVAGEDEAGCADSAYEDDGLDSFLDTPVLGPGGFEGWPLVGTELLGIGIGGDRWPHESWRCLSDRNATAVYLSALIQEEELDVAAMTGWDRECISQLPHDALLSGTAARVLKSEHEFVAPDVSEFFEEFDEVVVSRLFWCVSDLAGTVLEYLVDSSYGGELNDADLRCMTHAALDAAREPDVDRDELYVALTSDDFIRDGTEFGALVAILWAGADACLGEDDGVDLADEVDEAGPAGEADHEDGADPAEEVGELAGVTAVAVWEGTVDSTWADLFDRFSDAEWSCFLEAFDYDDELITWLLELPIALIFELSEWMEGVFGCLGRESAAYASVAMLADDLTLTRGLSLDPAAGECLRAAFVELDMATVWRLYANPEDLESELAESFDAALWRCLPDQGSEGLSGDTADPQAPRLWETVVNSTGSPVAVAPTVIDNVVLASDYSGGVWALDSAGGEPLWVFDHGGHISVPPSGAETVVLISGGSTHSALDARTGWVQWQWPRSGSTRGRPAFAAGVVFINETGSSFSSTVTAIDLATGTPVWASEVRTSELPLLFPLAVAGDRVLVSDDTTMHALDIETGAAVWSAGVSPGAQVAFSSGTVAVMGTVDPAEIDDTWRSEPISCLSGSATAYCAVARDAASGTMLWAFEYVEDVVGHAAVPGTVDGAFLVTGGGLLHAGDARSGRALWSAPVSLLLGTPFAAGESIFVVDLFEGLLALDAVTGAQKWALAVEGSGPMALEDGVLYLGSSQQEVHAIDAELGELLWTSRAVFADGDQRAFAIHDGMVFVGFQDNEAGGVRALAAPATGTDERSPTPSDRPEATSAVEARGNFETLLGLIPATQEACEWAILNDYARARDAHGIALPGGQATIEDLEEYIRHFSTTAYFAWGPWLSGYSDLYLHALELQPYWGYDVRHVDQSIESDPISCRPGHFEVVVGRFSPGKVEGAATSCTECPDIDRERYKGIEFLTWGEDYVHNYAEVLRPPFFDVLGRLGRVAVLDSYIFRTLGTEEMRALIRAQSGESDTLADDSDMALVARTLDGLGAYSALLSGNAEVLDARDLYGCDFTCSYEEIEAARAHFNTAPLDEYDALGSGIGVDSSGLFISIVFVYGDQDTAERNVQAFRKRLDTWSARSGQRWTDIFPETNVWHEGRTLISKLRSELAPIWQEIVLTLDPLLLYR